MKRFVRPSILCLSKIEISLLGQFIRALLYKNPEVVVLRLHYEKYRYFTDGTGLLVAKRGMDWSNRFWGKYAALRTTIWAKGYKTDHINHIGLSGLETKENIAWFDKAVESYYLKRVLDLFAQIGNESEEKIIKSFKEILTEMYVESTFLKTNLLTL